MGIDYVICAAGAGSRMQAISKRLPKPLIKLSGKTLLEYSLESLDLFPGDQLIIIVQKNHKIISLNDLLEKKYSFVKIKWVEIDGITSGQAATALLAKPHLSVGNGLVIFNSDTFFRSRGLLKALGDLKFDGIIPCSVEKGNSWSFCDTKESQTEFPLVSHVTEKVRVSDWCSVGYYYFKNARHFIDLAEAKMKEQQSGEFYVAPLYNELIRLGKIVVIDKVDIFKPLGSVEQLIEYWNPNISQMILENKQSSIVVDLDSTLTKESSASDYSKKLPRNDVISKLQELNEQGFEIIIYTARRMKTHSNNEGKVIADIGEVTLKWLKKHKVPFSAIHFGKPFAVNGFYIDDRSIRPSEFLNLTTEQIFQILNKENETD